MSKLCGWLAHTSIEYTFETISSNISESIKASEKYSINTLGKKNCGLVSVNSKSTEIEYNGQTFYIFVDGQPCWNEDNLRTQSDDANFARTFIIKYLENGPELLNNINGPFAIALINQTANEVFLAVDRTGINSLVYTHTPNNLLFGSNADIVNAHPIARPELDLQSLYNYFYFHVLPTPNSIYKNYKRTLPGSYVLYKNGTIIEERYWRLYSNPANTSSDFQKLKGEFLGLLEDSVSSAKKGSEVPGTFLSGGTDSSTVTGMLSKTCKQQARSFSIGFDAEGFDEMDFARITARHFNTKHHEYYVTPNDVVNAIPKIASAYDQPYGNSSAVPVYYCAKLAKDNGIDILLAGDGGDELFGGNARYAKQKLFSLYEHAPAFIRKKMLEPLFLNYASGVDVYPVNKIRSYIDQASIPMPARIESYNLLNRLGATTILTSDFIAHISEKYPMKLIDDEYFSCHANNLVDRMLALDTKFTLADNDLPKVTTMCELAGVNVSFPLLDARIMDFSTKLPPNLKLKGNKLRYFFKEALKDFLPPETITKQKQGFGLPFGLWLLKHKPLQQLVFDSLNSLKNRNIVKAEFLDDLQNKHLKNHASYYGTLVWILVMLEQWFEKNPNTASFKL